MEDDFELDVGTVKDKVLVKGRCCCGCKNAASLLRARKDEERLGGEVGGKLDVRIRKWNGWWSLVVEL